MDARDWMRGYAFQAGRFFSTALTTCRLARDLWKGLSAGTLRYDPESFPSEQTTAWTTGWSEARVDLDEDLIDEDPPRPKVAWETRPSGKWEDAAGMGWLLHADESDVWWRWSATMEGGERTEGATALGMDEAKRRAEEALAVMLERVP